MNFYMSEHSGTVVHAALSHRAAVDGTDPCEHCGRGGRRALPARVRLWCQRGPVRRDRLAEHCGPATCKMCLRWHSVARDARGDGWQPAATYAHSWCSVAAALDDQDRDGVRVEMAQREAVRLAQPCAGECGGPVAGQ